MFSLRSKTAFLVLRDIVHALWAMTPCCWGISWPGFCGVGFEMFWTHTVRVSIPSVVCFWLLCKLYVLVYERQTGRSEDSQDSTSSPSGIVVRFDLAARRQFKNRTCCSRIKVGRCRLWFVKNPCNNGSHTVFGDNPYWNLFMTCQDRYSCFRVDGRDLKMSFTWGFI